MTKKQIKFLSSIKQKSAFTLIELIIVVVILAIIWTISFVSLSGYMVSSRNAQRITDAGVIISWLKSYKQKSWSYPSPSEKFNIINYWSENIEIYQWVIDNNVSISTLNSIPVDPKIKKAYSYSITRNRQNFQIWLSMESADNDKKQFAFVDWDYKTLAKNLFPSLLIAWNFSWNIEIHDWIITDWSNWSINRQYFILNNWTYNLPYDFTSWDPVANWTTVGFTGIITEPEVTFWTNSDYWSCEEIYEAGKYLGIWDYQILNSSWSLVYTYCDWWAGVLVNWDCTWLPANAYYYSWATTYTLLNASIWTSLIANYTWSTIQENTCQFNCKTGFSRDWIFCNEIIYANWNDAYVNRVNNTYAKIWTDNIVWDSTKKWWKREVDNAVLIPDKTENYNTWILEWTKKLDWVIYVSNIIPETTFNKDQTNNLFVSPILSPSYTYCQLLDITHNWDCITDNTWVTIKWWFQWSDNILSNYHSWYLNLAEWDLIYNWSDISAGTEQFTPTFNSKTSTIYTQYISRQSYNSSSSYCESLYGTGWRLPTDFELWHDNDTTGINHGWNDVYTGSWSTHIWSSSRFQSSVASRWTFFSDTSEWNSTSTNINSNQVRCVFYVWN